MVKTLVTNTDIYSYSDCPFFALNYDSVRKGEILAVIEVIHQTHKNQVRAV